MKGKQRSTMKGRLTLFLYAFLITEILGLILSLATHSMYADVPTDWFLVFGLITTPVVMSWLTRYGEEAYLEAVSRGFLYMEGIPSRVVSIADDCPKRWLVLLHIQLHPELVAEGDRGA